MQNTFIRVCTALRKGTVPEFEGPWLYKIAHNVCLSRLLGASRRARVETTADLDALAERGAAHTPDADELFGLGDALADMPPNLRRPLLMREWQGMSYMEIAEALGVSHSAVETLIFRARRHLAQALTDTVKKTGRAIASIFNLRWLADLARDLGGGAGRRGSGGGSSGARRRRSRRRRRDRPRSPACADVPRGRAQAGRVDAGCARGPRGLGARKGTAQAGAGEHDERRRRPRRRGSSAVAGRPLGAQRARRGSRRRLRAARAGADCWQRCAGQLSRRRAERRRGRRGCLVGRAELAAAARFRRCRQGDRRRVGRVEAGAPGTLGKLVFVGCFGRRRSPIPAAFCLPSTSRPSPPCRISRRFHRCLRCRRSRLCRRCRPWRRRPRSTRRRCRPCLRFRPFLRYRPCRPCLRFRPYRRSRSSAARRRPACARQRGWDWRASRTRALTSARARRTGWRRTRTGTALSALL